MSEIRLRAIAQIGKISRELEKAQVHGGKICLPSGWEAKSRATRRVKADQTRKLLSSPLSRVQQIRAAGLAVSTVTRYEQLARHRRATLAEYFATAPCGTNGGDL